MITGIYFLLLLAASVEDYRSHRVNGCWIAGVWLLGIINIIVKKENRWVTITLTCICFILLYLWYALIRHLTIRRESKLKLGGADVRLIPAMMLVQGWDVALMGIFAGLVAAIGYYLITGKGKQELPLIPWMTAGCFLIEIIYLFFEKGVL